MAISISMEQKEKAKEKPSTTELSGAEIAFQLDLNPARVFLNYLKAKPVFYLWNLKAHSTYRSNNN